MKTALLHAALAALLAHGGQAQTLDQGADGVWATLEGVDSADLAIRGWTLAGTSALPAGEQTGLLVTFWRSQTGTLVRCVFSLVSASGAQSFETCSVAAQQTARQSGADGGGADGGGAEGGDE
ncbi:MAG: hypothetical protein AAFP13_11845 [Pseudomonadota bacterium]